MIFTLRFPSSPYLSLKVSCFPFSLRDALNQDLIIASTRERNRLCFFKFAAIKQRFYKIVALYRRRGNETLNRLRSTGAGLFRWVRLRFPVWTVDARKRMASYVKGASSCASSPRARFIYATGGTGPVYLYCININIGRRSYSHDSS